MRGVFRLIRQDKILSRFFLISAAIIVATLIYIVLVYGKLPPVVPIFNQLPWGDQRLGPKPAIFFPDLLVFIVFIVNLFLSTLIYSKSPLLARMLAVTCFLIALLTFLFIFRTVQIVI